MGGMIRTEEIVMADGSTPRQFLQHAVRTLMNAHFRGGAELEAAIDTIMAPYYQRQREMAKHLQELEREYSELKAQLMKLQAENDRINELEDRDVRMKAILRVHGIDPDGV